VLRPVDVFCAKAKRLQQRIFVCAKAKRQQQHEGRHNFSHFGNATGRGVFTDACQLAVTALNAMFLG